MSNEPLESLRPPDDLKLHHIGFVVSSIHEAASPLPLPSGQRGMET